MVPNDDLVLQLVDHGRAGSGTPAVLARSTGDSGQEWQLEEQI